MARPSKCRKICSEPVYDSFRPEGFPSDGTICLTLDEFEAIRLIDLEHFTHEKCAKQMKSLAQPLQKSMNLPDTKLQTV